MLSSAHVRLLIDRANWLDNPLAVREARRDRKRKQPYKAYAWALTTLSLLFTGMALLIGRRHANGLGVPWYLGGSVGTALCVAICGVHSWFITGAMRKHTAAFLLQEARSNTLPGLLTLPIPPLQLLVRTGVYAWIAAMRVAVVGLPFYAFAVAAGGFSILDLVMLYVVFALLSLGFAAWTRPVLSENAALAIPMGAQESKTGTPIPPGQQVNAGQAGIPFVLPLIVMAIVMPALVTGGTGGIYSSLRTYAPDSLLQLAPSFLLSWPLLVARALITPLDWFGWRVAPLPFVLIFAILGRYLSLVRSAEFLSVGTYRDLASHPTYHGRRALETRVRFAWILVGTGYLWKWGIENGGLSAFGPRGMPVESAPIAAFAFALATVTAWRWIGRVRAVATWTVSAEKTSDKPRQVIIRLTPRTAAAYVVTPLLSAFAYYAACCLLSRTSPIPPGVAVTVGKILAIAAAGGVLGFMFVRSTGFSPVLPGMFVAAMAAFGPPELRSMSVLSPALGMLLLGPTASLGWFGFGSGPPPGLVSLFARTPPWWQWPAACGAAGLAFAALVPARIALSRRRAETAATPPPSAMAVVIDPATVGPEVYYDALFEKKDSDGRRDSALGNRVIDLISGVTDNAVVAKEARIRLRGKLGTPFLRGAAIAFGVVTLGLLGSPRFALALGGGLAAVLFGPLPSQTAQVVASVLALYYIIMTWMALSAGINVIPIAFAPEREKSTLGFMLMTPMSSASIAFGKVVGLACGNSPGLIVMFVSTLSLSVLFSPVIGPVLAITVWIRCLVVAAIVLFSASVFGVGVAALFPRSISQAGCGGLLVGLMVQVPIQLLVHVGRLFGPMAGQAGTSLLDEPLFWAALVSGAAVLAALGWVAAMFGLWRLRRGDIAFEPSRREN